uniref:Uncharacterized protein n=1 Tax=Anguilla anguilla TaxID=7936 RepID=A0A0E9QI43_ANGAN
MNADILITIIITNYLMPQCHNSYFIIHTLGCHGFSAFKVAGAPVRWDPLSVLCLFL